MDREIQQRCLDHPALAPFANSIAAGESVCVDEIWTAPKALLIALAQEKTGKSVVVLTHDSNLHLDLSSLATVPLHEFPAWETLPGENLPPSPDIVGERYALVQQLQKENGPSIILSSLNALLGHLLPPSHLQTHRLTLKLNEEFLFEELPQKLVEMGYERRPLAVEKGEFAVRGGIVDLFPLAATEPVRIEFFDEEIVSMRTFDPVGQTSTGKLQEVLITPAEEFALLSGLAEKASLFDYLQKDLLIVYDDLLAIEDKVATIGNVHAPQFLSFSELQEQIKKHQTLYFTPDSLEELSGITVHEKGGGTKPYALSFEIFGKTIESKRWHSPLLPIASTFCSPDQPLDRFDGTQLLVRIGELQEKVKLLFLNATDAEERALKKRLPPHSQEVEFARGYLSSGWFLESPHTAVIPNPEISGRTRLRRQKQRTAHHTLAVELFAMHTGEAVVHEEHGVARYLGVEKKPNHLGEEGEFLLLEYAKGSKLYVPIDQAHQVSKYVGATEQKPELHVLGANRWQQMRQRTQTAVEGYAKDLLELQAKRAANAGFAYPADSSLIQEFADDFPYQETIDQQKAIDAVNESLQTALPMDRLICGDVGYGKTEVAMRAAFKAVVDGGKQVAVLVPTTVLALQHYETFKARMSNFPIEIHHLSRFRKPKEIKESLALCQEGKVDILIGTHRILGKDVEFKNLGLIIIDEEQRFGVRAKESLKKLRTMVDCLTLSATPIPRTLYLSLIGARDLSVINTPPEDRLPIQTLIAKRNNELIKSALLRELAREGQSYFIHNRVETITRIADELRKLVPQARIVIAHGQMNAQELDAVFHAFKSGAADILVATSLIENGIDIPNANTILIDRSDRFGLADLYQMRGRVGRWIRKAYCYLLVPSSYDVNPIAKKRLTALAESSGHGGGMKIAMHDLELRGAGNILGTKQSGHIAQVGFQLYCRMLKKAVAALKKREQPFSDTDVKIEFPYPAKLPDFYIEEIDIRMEFYQRLGQAESVQEIEPLRQELIDRFGPLPSEVSWLLTLARIRTFASRNQFLLLRIKKNLLEAHQKIGKKERLEKKMLIGPVDAPEELERRVHLLLKKEFSLREPHSADVS